MWVISASQCFTCVLFHPLQALLLLQLLGWVFVPVYIACGVSQLLFGSLVRNETSRDVAQLVERRTGTPLTQIRFPVAARDFSHSHLSVQTLLRFCTPLVQSHALTFVRTLKIPSSMSRLKAPTN